MINHCMYLRCTAPPEEREFHLDDVVEADLGDVVPREQVQLQPQLDLQHHANR